MACSDPTTLLMLAHCSQTHPNRLPFHGVLATIDTPSDMAPIGAKQHRIILRRKVVRKALKSIKGMAVNCSPDCLRHNRSQKVGVITGAKIAAGKIQIRGYLYAHDFPEVALQVAAGDKGLSWEITILSLDRTKETWEPENFVFTGAAILKRHLAAYQSSSIALA